MIRIAKISDIDKIKEIAQSYTKEIGFVMRPALEDAVKRQELLYDDETGSFCHYRYRRDGVSVIYEICVPQQHRGKGIAKTMINMILTPVQLKCPVDNESNAFYKHIGFELIETLPGKKRELNVWRLERNETEEVNPGAGNPDENQLVAVT